MGNRKLSRRNQRRLLACAFAAAASLAHPAISIATTRTWNNSTADNRWIRFSNWTGSIAPTTADPVILATPGPADSHIIDLTGFHGATGIAIASAASIEADDSYTLNNETLTCPGAAINVASAATLTINSAIVSSTGLTKTGTGTLVLGGSSTFTGTMNITQGVVSAVSDSSLGSVSGITLKSTLEAAGTFSTSKTITPDVGGNATISVTSGNNLTLNTAFPGIANDLTKKGPGELTLTKPSSRSGTFFLSQGTLRLESGTGAGSNANIHMGNATLELANVTAFGSPLTLGLSSTIVGIGNAGVQYISSTHGSDVSPTFQTGTSSTDTLDLPPLDFGTSNSLITIAGAGTVKLSDVNYPGKLTVSSGTAYLTTSTSLGSSSTPITVADGAALAIDASSISRGANVGNNCTIRGGPGVSHFGAITIPTNDSLSIGNIASYGAGTFFTLGNANLNGGSGGTLHVVGPGTVIVTSNHYVGNWSLDSGTLGINSDASLGFAAATLALNGGKLSARAAFTSPRPITLNASGGTIDTAGWAVTFAAIEGTGSLAKNGSGTLTVSHVRTNDLSVTQGTLAVAQNGSASGVSIVNSISIAAGASIDLRNNALIDHTTGLGAWNGSHYDGITGFVASQALKTSQSQAVSQITTLAVAKASDVSKTTFFNQPVDPNDVLVMYTYAGDANLDGEINGDDYVNIDQGFADGSTGYARGDFNYDGKINADDYFLIDHNYSAQTTAFSSGAPLGENGISPVPEPALLVLTPAGITLFVARRRKTMLKD